jgi:hypothetical protein
MPDNSRKVNQLDPHYTSDIRSETIASTLNDHGDVYLVLGDQHTHVEVRPDDNYSLAAACAQIAEK